MPYGKKSPTKMGHSPAEMSPYKMGHSPNEMGHSPMENQNKGYAKQERKDLMQDMPIVKDAMGGRSWMSKHSKSALRMGHSPAEMKQGYNARLDESLAKDGKESTKKQSMKDRRDESKGMEKSKGKKAYSSDPSMS